MKTATVITAGLGGSITAAAAVGWPALAGFGILLLVIIGVLCWIVASRYRTLNIVSIIAAARGSPIDSPAELHEARADEPEPAQLSNLAHADVTQTEPAALIPNVPDPAVLAE